MWLRKGIIPGRTRCRAEVNKTVKNRKTFFFVCLRRRFPFKNQTKRLKLKQMRGTFNVYIYERVYVYS